MRGNLKMVKESCLSDPTPQKISFKGIGGLELKGTRKCVPCLGNRVRKGPLKRVRPTRSKERVREWEKSQAAQKARGQRTQAWNSVIRSNHYSYHLDWNRREKLEPISTVWVCERKRENKWGKGRQRENDKRWEIQKDSLSDIPVV